MSKSEPGLAVVCVVDLACQHQLGNTQSRVTRGAEQHLLTLAIPTPKVSHEDKCLIVETKATSEMVYFASWFEDTDHCVREGWRYKA